MVNISIQRMDNDIIATTVDLTDIQSRGELSHVLVELECIKMKVLKKWIDYGDEK